MMATYIAEKTAAWLTFSFAATLSSDWRCSPILLLKSRCSCRSFLPSKWSAKSSTTSPSIALLVEMSSNGELVWICPFASIPSF
eukprot:SAG25_NODE_193_length_12184_cov_5.527844_17_plen_84_part_00